jgi:hypothetical protein
MDRPRGQAVPELSRQDREALAEKRLLRILAGHTIATARTLEQKISDAGPYGQRIDPHILTAVRNRLIKDGKVLRHEHQRTPWFYLPSAAQDPLNERFQAQLPVHQAFSGALSTRIGQTLEIAVYRVLSILDDAEFFGRFLDLDAHDDSTLYAKEEPPRHIGKYSLTGDKLLDFIIRDPKAGYLGVECKNIRSWLYPDREEITDTIRKCLALNCVPVIIARRIPYVTFMLLSKCGMLFHQNYNQLLPSSDKALADQARDKNLLGYHDIRVGNEPDNRLVTFLATKLPTITEGAREKFEAHKDLLQAFSEDQMSYHEFAARVLRRFRGENEDGEIATIDPADWT